MILNYVLLFENDLIVFSNYKPTFFGLDLAYIVQISSVKKIDGQDYKIGEKQSCPLKKLLK